MKRQLPPWASLHPAFPPRLSGSRRRDAELTRAAPLASGGSPLGVFPSSAVCAGSSDEPSSFPTLRGVSPQPNRPDAVSSFLLCPHHPELYGLQPLPRQSMETQQERWVLLCRSRVGSGAPAAALAPGLRWAGPCPPPGLWAPHFPGPGALPRARSFLSSGGAASRVSPASCGRSGLRGAVRTHVSCRASTSELFSIGLSLSLFFNLASFFFLIIFCLFLFLVLSTISPALIFLYLRHPRAPQTLSPDGFRPAYLQLCVCVSVLCLCLRARVGQKARARGLGRGTKSLWRICISRKRAILSSSGP